MYSVPIEWVFNRMPDGILIPEQPGKFAIRSQDIEKKYFDAGLFIAFPSAIIQAFEGAGSDAGFVGYIIPRSKAIDIDEEAGWALAETMYRKHFESDK